MSAREIIADAYRDMELNAISADDAVSSIIARLQSAGYRILAQGEADPWTLEDAAKVAKSGWVSADYDTVGIADADMAMALCEHVEASIRALGKDGA